MPITVNGPNGIVVNFPDGTDAATIHGAMSQASGASTSAQSSGAMDLVKSFPGAMVRGAKGALDLITQEGTDYADKGFDPLRAPIEKGVSAVNAAMPPVPGRTGNLVEAVGQGLGNPLSFVGPGGPLLKIGGSVLSSLGGEGARQAAEGTPYEGPASVAGALVSGTAAVKTMGAKPLAAAVPNAQELRGAKDAGYQTARNADLVLDPKGPASWAAEAEHELTNGTKYAFTGGKDGTAPKTLAVLAEQQRATGPQPSEGMAAALSEAFGGPQEYFKKLQNVESGNRIVTGADLNALRIKLGNIAGETKDFRPTPDAKAAMVAKRSLEKYTESIPQDHVLAGDAQAYNTATKTANANNAAFRRVESFDQKLTNATDATEGSIAAKLDNQIKSKVRNGYLTNEKKQRGLTGEEVDAIRQTNSGSRTERLLRQVGRFAPEGPMNLALHVGTGLGAAAATGGMSVPIQIAAALAASGAKHTAQRMTQSNANKVAEMLAKRSPLYRERASLTELYNQLKPTQGTNRAALIRALLAH